MSKFLKQKNMACHTKRERCRGFTLVETLVAISIFTLSILGLISILASSVSDINYAKQKIVAGYLAQEGIEHARNIRDTHVLYDASGTGWGNFLSDPNVTNYSSPSDYSTFIRTITKTAVNADEEKIISTVTWTQGSGTYHITFSENLFNWVE